MKNNADNPQPPKHLVIITAVAVIIVILILVFFSWLLTRGVESNNSDAPTSEQQTQNAPLTDPSNPNIEQGPSGSDNTKTIPTDGTAP